MAIRKINGNWYVDIRVNRKRFRKKSIANSKAGAKAYEASVLQTFAKGGNPFLIKTEEPETITTFAEFAKQFVEVYAKNNNKPSEIHQKQAIMRTHLIPFFGTYKLDEINNLLVEQYKAKKAKAGAKNKTINNQLAVLSKCLRIAQEWAGLKTLPKIKLLNVPPQKFDFLSPVESDKLLLNTIDDELLHDMVLLALKTGMRFGELAGLDWADVNLEKEILTVRHSFVRGDLGSPKNNKTRDVPLTSEVCEMLDKRKKTGDFVFYSSKGKRLKYDKYRLLLQDACQKVGLRKIAWHTLRHTFASHLACKGVSLKTIQELLGHSDMKMTMRYAHLSPSTLREAINLLDKPVALNSFGQYLGNGVGQTEKIPVLNTSKTVLI
jgi:integrase